MVAMLNSLLEAARVAIVNSFAFGKALFTDLVEKATASAQVYLQSAFLAVLLALAEVLASKRV